MTQRGEHTWDLVWRYHQCPECGYIIESREGFGYRMGEYFKEVECPRCGREFILKRLGQVPIGPIFSEGARQEVNWEG